jgi:xanthine dehydrogenase accessory factor
MSLSWQRAVAQCETGGTPFVLATVLATSGSTPRTPGSKMVVCSDALFDSIGGGQLENLVVARARQLLDGTTDTREITHFPLAAAALQCCGGSMTVLLEAFGLSAMRLCIFGAGHVGRRVAMLMQEVACNVELVDSRADQLELAPQGVRRVHLDAPARHVDALRPNSHVLVMTHDHQLDYELMLALLARPAAPSLGLIGSRTKWDRFRRRLLADGVPIERIAKVRCPVGRTDIPGKEPMAVAIAVAAQLLQFRAEQQALAQEQQQQQQQQQQARGLSWRGIRSSLLPAAEVEAQACLDGDTGTRYREGTAR